MFKLYPSFTAFTAFTAMLALTLGLGSAHAAATNFPELRVTTQHATEDTTLDNGTKVRRHLDVYYPQADGEMPVLLVVAGLNGVLPTGAYSQFLQNIASRGVIVVVPNGQFLMAERYRERAEEVAAAAQWLPLGLPRLLATRGAKHGAPTPLVQKGLYIMGHSSGAQAAMAAQALLPGKVSGVVLLDPVDGDPYGFHPRVINEGTRYPQDLPALLVTTELCNQPGWNFKWFPACCPPGISAEHFYAAFTGKRWWANSLDFGHVDLLNDPFTLPVNWVGFCKASDGKLSKHKYRDFVATHVAGFAHAVSWGLAFPPGPSAELQAVRYVMRAD